MFTLILPSVAHADRPGAPKKIETAFNPYSGLATITWGPSPSVVETYLAGLSFDRIRHWYDIYNSRSVGMIRYESSSTTSCVINPYKGFWTPLYAGVAAIAEPWQYSDAATTTVWCPALTQTFLYAPRRVRAGRTFSVQGYVIGRPDPDKTVRADGYVVFVRQVKIGKRWYYCGKTRHWLKHSSSLTDWSNFKAYVRCRYRYRYYRFWAVYYGHKSPFYGYRYDHYPSKSGKLWRLVR